MFRWAQAVESHHPCHASGLTLFVAGLALWITQDATSFVAMVGLGLLVFIPGVYYCR